MARHSGSKEAQLRAQAKYLEKVYKLVPIRFKKEEDKDILNALQQAQEAGISYRQSIRSWYEASKK